MSELENEKWSARALGERIGYKTWESIEGLVNKTLQFLLELELPYYKNVEHVRDEQDDFRLSKFAVFIFLLLADSKKAKVVLARKEFYHNHPYVEEVIPYLKSIRRVELRAELSFCNKKLTQAIASAAGKANYSKIINAKYRSLYHMDHRELMAKRSIPNEDSVFDYMGEYELTLNILLIRLTLSIIKNEQVKSINKIEKIILKTGAECRELTKNNLHVYPEHILPQVELSSAIARVRDFYHLYF